MNYPFRSAALDYIRGGNARDFVETMETLRENYPKFAFYSAMNSLGTHDTPRILTLLGVGSECRDRSREWRANFRMDPDQRRRGKELLKLGAALLFAFPGSPTVYYGDEVGMEGFEDPFNRRTFPWGHEDSELLGWFTRLGHLRQESDALRRGDIRYRMSDGPLLAFTRTWGEETILAAFNAGDQVLALRLEDGERIELLLGAVRSQIVSQEHTLILPPRTGSLMHLRAAQEDSAVYSD